jgi:RNA polymerase sigma-70 factor (ECF subfamily)
VHLVERCPNPSSSDSHRCPVGPPGPSDLELVRAERNQTGSPGVTVATAPPGAAVRRGAVGDEDLVRELYDATYRRLVGQLAVLTGSRAEAEDVVQEAFVRLLNRPRSLVGLDSPEAWLRTVAVNQARSRWRRMRRQVGLLPEVATDLGDGLTPDRVALLTALRQLPTPQREAIALHHLADLSVAEVATTLGVPAGTIKARLSRGRATLARLLADPSAEEDQVTHG